MKRIGILILSSLTYCTSTFAAIPSEPHPHSGAVAYRRLPLSFESNQGQADPRIRFTSRGNGYALALTDSGAVLSLSKPAPMDRTGSTKLAGKAKCDTVRMDLVASMPAPQITGIDKLAGTANYFIGNDAASWRTNVPTYSRVKYTGVYPGVDLVYYGNQRQLEYDFVLAPNANSAQIKLHFSGAEKLKLNADGDLTIVARDGSVAFHKPIVYQTVDGQLQAIASQYHLLGHNAVGFSIAAYDHSRELVIDPTLTYSTYIGGNGGADAVRAVAVDALGQVYLTGKVGSTAFPATAGAFSNSGSGIGPNVFVTKMNAAGDGLIYSTYIGGDLSEIANSITVDAQGNAYVVGSTISFNFPTTPGSFQPVHTTNFNSAFVTKLNPTGSALVYSSYLSGTNTGGVFNIVLDQANAVAVDSAGDAFVTGSANSVDFPVTSGAFQTVNKAAALAASNAFVTKVNPSGSALLYSSYLGGSGNGSLVNVNSSNTGDVGNGITLDTGGNVYVAGTAFSGDFPVTSDALQPTNKAFVNNGGNAFVTKINLSRPGLVYSTYLGGSGFFIANGAWVPGDIANAITVDAAGRAFIAGSATSLDFPVTRDALQKANNAGALLTSNAFIAELNSAATSLEFSTYFGGSGNSSQPGANLGETASGVAIDANGSVYVAGTAWSNDLSVTPDAFQSQNRAEFLGFENAFVAKLDAAGDSLQYSTYLGGSGEQTGGDIPADGDKGLAMALSANGDLYVGGSAASTDYPVSRNAFQKVNNDASTTGFVAKFAIGGIKAQATETIVTASSDPQRAGGKVTFNANVTSASGSAVPTGSLNVTVNGQFYVKVPLDKTGHATYTSIPLPAGKYNIAVAYSGDKVDLPSRATLVELVNP